MAFNIPEEIHGRVKISASNNLVILNGEIDQLDPVSFLTPFFNKINDQMEDEVFIDITNLKYLNSAGIRCLISFLIGRKPGTKVIFKINKTILWQLNSLDVIQEIDNNYITIQ